MLSFKSFISEDLSPKSLDKALFIIAKYIKKQTGRVLFTTGVEEFDGGGANKGYGMRYYLPKKNQSFRLNWKTGSAQNALASLTSITFWNGIEDKPYIITFESGVSLIKILPLLAGIIKSNKVPKLLYTLPDDVALAESTEIVESLFLAEMAVEFGMPEIFDGVLELLGQPNFSKGKVYGKYKGAGYKVLDELERRYPQLIVKQGTGYVWAGKDKDFKAITKQRDDVLKSIGVEIGVTSRGTGSEKYTVDSGVTAIENDMERLTFEEQLKDLENLTKLTISGSSNALFVAGKGGVGKTHTVEDILSRMGLRDGKGYFKNTGSASAVGIYNLLYKYQNDILFFDDCDSAFKDQESRNVFKSATDTKKVRKLVWNKKGNTMNPDDFSKDEIMAAEATPMWFEFTGKVIVISNLTLDQLDPDGALRTRGFIINIDPTVMEIYDFMDKIVDKMPLNDGLQLDLKGRRHVVQLLRNSKSKDAPNLRKLVRGLNLVAGAQAAGVEESDEKISDMISRYA